MNKWIRRTAGTVGIAGGALLFGTAAHADNPVIADPQSLHDLTDVADVDGGLGGVGVSVDTPGQRDTIGLLPDSGGPLRSGTNNGELGMVVHTPTQDGQPRDVFASGRTPDIFQALPITDVVPMDGLGLPNSGASSGLTGGPRTLPAPAAESLGIPSAGGLGLPEANGLPVQNIPLNTSMTGDTLRGGDALASDGLAGNGLGVPLGDQLPVGAAQNVASQGQALGGQALGGGLPLAGGLPLGGGLPLAGGGLPLGAGGGRSATTPGAGQSGPQSAQSGPQTGSQTVRGQARPVLAGDAVHVLPPSESVLAGSMPFTEAGLPSAGGVPVVGDVLQGGTLPMRGNINTLPGAPTLPVHDLIGPGTAAAGASTGNAFNNATGTVGNLTQSASAASAPSGTPSRTASGATEALPLGGGLPLAGGGLPVVGGLTGSGGTSGLPLGGSGGLPVVGGLAGGLTGADANAAAASGKHRAAPSPTAAPRYIPKHAG